jgi:glycogen(starch) synthase
MRVLHLTTEFPPVIYGGLGTAVGGWVRASVRSGLSVGVFLVGGVLQVDDDSPSYGSPRSGAQATDSPEPVVDREGVVFFQSTWPTAVEAGLRLIEEWQPHVIHLHTAMLWPIARALHEQTRKPLVYHVHSLDRAEYEIGQEPSPWLAHSEAQDAAIATSDRLIALSRSERDLLVSYYPDAHDRVRIVGNGIDDSDFAREAAYRERGPGSALVLYSGRLVERKGIRELLAAIPRVLDVAPDTRFVFAGGPPPLSGAEVAGQWLTSDHEPYRDRIHFTGWLTPDQVAQWYAAADVLVVPSRYEPFGMVLLEGMLFGLPIVACDVGGPAEILDHERTGILVPPCNAEALAEGIERLVGDPRLRWRIGHAAAVEVRSRWAWPHLVSSMRLAYDEIADEIANARAARLQAGCIPVMAASA